VRDLFGRIEQISDNLDRLIEKAQLWQSIVDECPLGIAVFTANMQFFVVNATFKEISKYTDQEIIGKKLNMILPKELVRMHHTKEKEFASNPERKINRHGLSPKLLTKTGESIDVGIDLSYIEHDGKVYYVAFVKVL
jgi:PAS domain S-box-containing protein